MCEDMKVARLAKGGKMGAVGAKGTHQPNVASVMLVGPNYSACCTSSKCRAKRWFVQPNLYKRLHMSNFDEGQI